MSLKRIAIIGATGYTGSELTRLLHGHPKVELTAITSESHAGKRFSDIHPQFRGLVDLELIPAADLDAKAYDALFLALPHGVSMDYVARLDAEAGLIIDLSGDFRLDGPETYRAWYGKEHRYAEGFGRAVYGIPELFENEIRGAKLIANPGCYPTGALLALAPMLAAGFLTSVGGGPVIVDSKSGVTGAGVSAGAVNQFSNVHDNFRAYGISTHRHSIEIEQYLDRISGARNTVQFTPHLLPVDRGILTTAYVVPEKLPSQEALVEQYRTFYRHRKFIRLRSDPPEIKNVRGTNFCDIHLKADARTGAVIAVSAIDNLVRGAAGQAVQNMNLALGLDEGLGLNQVPLRP